MQGNPFSKSRLVAAMLSEEESLSQAGGKPGKEEEDSDEESNAALHVKVRSRVVLTVFSLFVCRYVVRCLA